MTTCITLKRPFTISFSLNSNINLPVKSSALQLVLNQWHNLHPWKVHPWSFVFELVLLSSAQNPNLYGIANPKLLIISPENIVKIVLK